ncbi:MAG: Fic family protein, partial [Methanobacteriota archaeon]
FGPPSPVEVDVLLQEFFRWYAPSRDRLHPVELAALVHLKFVTVHPFADGNGRVARLLMNFVLHERGYPMLNIPYEGRARYYAALERAQTKGVEGIFVQWFLRHYVRSHRRLLMRRLE